VSEARGAFREIRRSAGFRGVRRVLEVACGPGFLSHLIAVEYPLVQVLGTDISEESIRYAQTRNGNRPNLRYAVRDGYELNGAEPSYDLTLCTLSLHHFADPERLVREMVRVTRPGGKCYLEDFTRDVSPRSLDRIESMERSGDVNHGQDTLSASLNASLSRDEYRKLASRLGVEGQELHFFRQYDVGVFLPFVRWVIKKP
jgi:ubiquinone/menaquinone biosynthesis C-methylase UbiE